MLFYGLEIKYSTDPFVSMYLHTLCMSSEQTTMCYNFWSAWYAFFPRQSYQSRIQISFKFVPYTTREMRPLVLIRLLRFRRYKSLSPWSLLLSYHAVLERTPYTRCACASTTMINGLKTLIHYRPAVVWSIRKNVRNYCSQDPTATTRYRWCFVWSDVAVRTFINWCCRTEY